MALALFLLPVIFSAQDSQGNANLPSQYIRIYGRNTGIFPSSISPENVGRPNAF